MSIKYQNIFDADADIVVVAVNAEGVMGRGQALEFSRRYPEATMQYKYGCMNEFSHINTHGYVLHKLDDKRDVLFFVTKKTWRENSTKKQLQSVFKSLRDIETDYFAGKLVATPPLGAGLGRLQKQEVIPYLKKSFISLGAFVDIYDLPIYKPKEQGVLT